MSARAADKVQGFWRYWLGLLAGGLAALAVTVGGISFLAWEGRLAPPPLTKVNYMDEKLRYLRQHQELDPNLVLVGSSMALRQFDGAPFEARLGKSHVLNGASTLLRVHQTRFLTHFYMDQFPHLKTIVLLVGPPDFENCTTIPAELFRPEDAERYAFRREAEAPFYLRYFSPSLYMARAQDYSTRRAPLQGDLWMDEYGSGPLQLPPEKTNGLRYGRLAFDHACVDALQSLVREIKARDIRPVVVFSPVHPDYLQRYPETADHLREVAERLSPLVAPGVDLFDMSESTSNPADFFDSVHLQWSAVRPFSEKLANKIIPRAAADATPTGDFRLSVEHTGSLQTSETP